MYIVNPKEWRDNFLRTIEMRYPKFIPCKVYFSQATWHKYRERLEDLALRYKRLFPGFKRGSIDFDNFGVQRKGNVFVDSWGCVWAFAQDGLQGQVIKHPLSDWRNLDKLKVPDPDEGLPVEGGPSISWDVVEEQVRKAREVGGLAIVYMPHGFFFQRLYYLRGYVNLMVDFVRKSPQLYKLIDILLEYNLELVKRILRMNVDIIVFGDDLGNQDRMPISPSTFREFIFPAYKRIFGLIRSHGVHVYLHTDGHVMEVVDQLIEAGVSVLNIQDRVNGIENIRMKCKGKVCIDLDIDRQWLLPFGTPEDIRSHIRRAIIKLGSRRGGLMFTAGVYPDVPLRNIEALCSALEDYMEYHKKLSY